MTLDGGVKEAEISSVNPVEQRRAAFKEIARGVLAIADKITEEKRLSGEAEFPNFAWLFRGAKSTLAMNLRELSEGNMTSVDNDRLAIVFKGLWERGLDDAYGNIPGRIAHGLTLDFLERLGFIEPNTDRQKTLTDRRKLLEDNLTPDRRRVVFTHPSKPYLTADCSIGGPLDTGGPQLDGLVLAYKTPN